ncbi:Uncharacterised protein [[Clostridium] sordellii]|uniref:hypothetical protein n=1 Tax=Paraclostridium sordellii TaxID=1505 RepID=UPI0005DE078E|nr:hypothetical protein [Paeniclostridium sordellii]CEQ10647.1 Uncharacterised protein [[Clostridium] sordellii] [Paeniclostridium sordellii]
MKLKKYTLILVVISVILIGAYFLQKNKNAKIESSKDIEKIQFNEEYEEYEDSKKENIIFIDDNNIKGVITEKRLDPFGAGYMISITNKTDKKIVVQTKDTVVNGTKEDAIISLDINPGETVKSMIQFMNIYNLDDLINVEGKVVILNENYKEIQSYDLYIK